MLPCCAARAVNDTTPSPPQVQVHDVSSLAAGTIGGTNSCHVRAELVVQMAIALALMPRHWPQWLCVAASGAWAQCEERVAWMPVQGRRRVMVN